MRRTIIREHFEPGWTKAEKVWAWVLLAVVLVLAIERGINGRQPAELMSVDYMTPTEAQDLP